MSQLPCQVMHLKSASVVQAAGDNSCLYHSLSYDLNHEEMYSNVYDENNNGFTLRHLVNDYIRDNLFKYIWTSPDICDIFADKTLQSNKGCTMVESSALTPSKLPAKTKAATTSRPYCRPYQIKLSGQATPTTK
jgi:hypothetical protein